MITMMGQLALYAKDQDRTCNINALRSPLLSKIGLVLRETLPELP